MIPVIETYLDHAASAPLLPEARAAIIRALDVGPGNASSSHAAGRRLRSILGNAREAVAALLGARPEQVIFTSGTTEANRLGVRGLLGDPGARTKDPKGAPCLVGTTANHDSLRALGAALLREGVEVRTVKAGRAGHVALEDVVAAAPARAVIALPLVESVTGALQPVARVAEALPGARVHVDGAQAVGRIPISLPDLGAAALSFSAHKIGGPQGIGALVLRADDELYRVDGEAAQERGRRAGTEAVALAAGLAAAAEVVRRELFDQRSDRERTLDALRRFVATTPELEWLTRTPHVPGVALLRVHDCPGDAVLAALDARRVFVSTGTACASGARTPPHVLTAAGWSARDAAECIRVSIGRETSEDDIARLIDALRDVIPRVRSALGTTPAALEKKLT